MPSLKRSAIVIHRWLGVSLCLVFLLWFPSGIGMMYWDFPEVTASDRLDRSSALIPSTIRLSPGDAYATLGRSQPPDQVRLNIFDGRPVYRFRFGRGDTIVYADTGERQTKVTPEMMARAASAWVGWPSIAVEPIDVDQWTVQGAFRNQKPLWKYSWPTGEQVYVSGTTGEVVQYTTRGSRIGAYLGPIPHWLYFTPLRKHQPEWSRVVIWSSGIGTFAAALGVIIGVWMYSPSKRYRNAGEPTAIPYRGYKRWHMVFGLIFGLGAVTWAFSGMLSMDPFPLTTGGATARRGAGGSSFILRALRGRLSLEAFATKHPQRAVEELAGLRVTELELTSVAGAPTYVATLIGGDTRIVPAAGEPRLGFEPQPLIDALMKAVRPPGFAELRLADRYDRYYLDRRRQRPLPVVLARLNDAEQTRLYIDPRTARVVGAYSAGNWASRWLYHGLHSLDFPWLYDHRPLWDIVVITFMLGGTALGVTSLILAWRVVGGKLARAVSSDRAGGGTAARDDLLIGGSD